MKEPVGGLFEFSKKERLGVILMAVVILGMLLFLNFRHALDDPIAYTAQAEMEKELVALGSRIDSLPDRPARSDIHADRTSGKPRLSAPFDFDPNTVGHPSLVLLGFSEKQAASIINYRTKGGVIRKVADFKELYVVNDYMFERLAPHIKIDRAILAEKESDGHRPDTHRKKKRDGLNLGHKDADRDTSKRMDKSEMVVLPVDLNSATKEELIALVGIGPVYGSNIIKYRNLLGGYVSTDQISEVYGLRDHPEIVERLLPQLTADPGLIAPRDINEDDWVALVTHPYIDKKVANAIIALREQHGPFSTVEELQQSHLVDPGLYSRIAPYLTVDGHR